MIFVIAFIASGIVVVIAGAALARHADSIADATGLGRLWIGSMLLAGATSLPELATDISAVRFGAIDLAVGDLFGSSLANMLILALIDLWPPKRRVLERVTFDHALAAGLAISLNALAAMFIIIQPRLAEAWVDPAVVVVFLAYVAGARAVYRHATRDVINAPDVSMGTESRSALRRALLSFGLAAIAVLAAAPAFAWSAQGIAKMTGLGETFVGTWLVGLATSLPELVSCVAAVRMGAFDLAVGNLFGSNALNMAILLPLDLAQPGGLLAAVDPGHAVSGLSAVVLMSLGLGAIIYRAKRRFSVLEPSSVLMLVAYAMSLWLLYEHSGGLA